MAPHCSRMCAPNESFAEDALLQQYCNREGLTLIRTSPYGHCFLEAFCTASTGGMSVSELKVKIQHELEVNLPSYRDWIPRVERHKWHEDLDRYLRHGIYNSSIVDLCVYAASNITATDIKIIEFCAPEVQTINITPQSAVSKRQVMLALINRQQATGTSLQCTDTNCIC